MKTISFVPLMGMLLVGCGQLAGAQYREALEYKIKDAQQAYETARAKGDALGMCTYSGLTAAAYADARDTPNSDAWRARRREDCVLAHTAVGSYWDEPPRPITQMRAAP